MTFDRSLAWLTLFSLLTWILHPSPAWPERFPPEPAFSRLREKPVEIAFQENTPKENPMDGNDWIENGDGTFTLKKSYLDEATFERSLEGMPYNDLDLYTMGLLDPNQVKSPFVIANPTLEDGRKLRMHSGGNLIEIQNPDGTWSGPYYLPTGIKVKGTRKTISLSDITALEGNRDPAYPNTPKDFKVAFLTATNTTDEETAIDTLEMTQKLNRFKDSFTRFFKDMARNLGNLLFPKGEAGSGSGGSGGGSGGGGGVFRLTPVIAACPPGFWREERSDEAISLG